MREILFRGKDSDGVWHEGFYVCHNGKSHAIYTGYAEVDCGEYYPQWFTVDPSTVGQYTGLNDKNGKKIFEGDIIRWRKERGCGCFIGQVIYGSGCFCCKYGANSPAIDIVMNETFTGVEVIGNIHDNPELLEGTT